MKRLRVHFDLDSLDGWHRREWEARLSIADTHDAEFAANKSDADCVIAPSSLWHFSDGGRCFGRDTSDREHPPRFVWEQGDLPSGHERGFYCSLPSSLFDQRRHRTCHYVISYNECVDAGDFSEARKLAGFVGGITSGLRSRLVDHLRALSDPEILCEQQAGPWSQMFDRSGLAVKKSYASAIRSCRFFLCPRGNGVGSVRLFETMQSARVPVILSDDYVLPPDIDWPSCSVRIRESDITRLPEILHAYDASWPALATAARHEWERHFSGKNFLTTLARGVDELHSASSYPPPTHALRRLFFLSHLKTRQSLGRLRQRFRVKPSPSSS